jgi:hypothetical protein
MKMWKRVTADYWFVRQVQRKEEGSGAIFSDIWSLIGDLEKCIVLGMLQCINALMYTICVLPLRILIAPERHSLYRFFILAAVSLHVSYMMSLSRLYHDLKEQDFLKLNFVYNIIGVSDQLLMAFGIRCMNNLTRSIENLVVALIYVWLHTMHLSLAITVFEVALNSSKYNLMLLVLSSAFVETKITVFKKHDRKALLNVIHNDIVERLQLFLYMFTILAKAMISSRSNVDDLCKGIIIVILTSVAIDWVKHYFVLSFSGMNPGIYNQICLTMKENWSKMYETDSLTDGETITQNALDPSCSLALSYKFVVLPQVCMLLRSFSSLIFLSSALGNLTAFLFLSFCKLLTVVLISLFP